jgi:CRISPR-associated endonuclease/helicase Cas3
LLEQRPWLLKQLARCAGMDTESVLRLMVLLIGLHDLGKFADNFQRKRCDLYALAFPDRVHMALDSSVRHDQLGWTLWCSGPADAPRQMLKQRLLQWDDVQIKNIMAASCGHHGLPPVKGDTQSLGQAMCSAARADALDFAQRWIEFIWPIELGSIETPCADPERLQWLLAGIAVWCDWLGSNTQWFAYKPAPADPAADWTSYWNYAQQRAR